ncbi:E3 ubiquitin-protein ligase XIAP-like [Ylistrum balloti]|uniref:E3 ubiquitin-protein ligase XIAP-like n=1 Tax=Ylistrum balloti TaxID=509963 RepID=UPI002905DFA7|nr:E3 ubiquitin-protein ligase XIAP-like [Ylistrum balloti]
MEDETLRYTTFAAFPQSCPITPSQLSGAGFHYEGTADEVICHNCGFKYMNWQTGDNPLVLHQQQSPSCHVVCNQVENQNFEEISHQHHENDRNTHTNIRSLQQGIGQSEARPRFPYFESFSARLQSFNQWQHTTWSSISLNVFANAGLFYEGNYDIVTCFYCGGRLGHWDRGDDPFFKHACYYPACPYVRQSKDYRFKIGFQSENLRKDYEQSSSGPIGGNIPENIEELFQHAAVQAVRTCQNNEMILKGVERLRSKGEAHFNASNLMQCILDIEDEEQEAKQKKEDDEKKRLEDENEELRFSRLCKVCLANDFNTVFLPCCHLCCCAECASNFQICPICRQNITTVVKVFIS